MNDDNTMAGISAITHLGPTPMDELQVRLYLDGISNGVLRVDHRGLINNATGSVVACMDRLPEPLRLLQHGDITDMAELESPYLPGIQCDAWIREMAESFGMISPFVPHQRKTNQQGEKILSYGLSSFGYDARIGPEFQICTNENPGILDPKADANFAWRSVKADTCILPPHGFALAHTVEYFKIPRDTLVVCLGKSTLARLGLIVNVTPLEPGWEGQVTIEISNTTPLPAKIYANEGICQFLFFRGSNCSVSYKDKGGKYQGQTGVTRARV